jgi:hypothetical protein
MRADILTWVRSTTIQRLVPRLTKALADLQSAKANHIAVKSTLGQAPVARVTADSNRNNKFACNKQHYNTV